MVCTRIHATFVFLLALTPLLAQQPKPQPKPSAEGIEFFEKKIRPVLATNCYPCHSAKSKPVQGGYLLDSRDGIRRGGNSGNSPVGPRRPEDSTLLGVLRHKGFIKMPPGKPLSDEVIADVETWIKMGAPDPRTEASVMPPPYDFNKAREHWSYRPVTNPGPPAVADPLWNRNPVDRFIRAKLAEKKLTPAGLASKRTLIRRATFDLTGLPPTPEEVDAFLKDVSPEAYDKLLDRLLASAQYGERWGRHWLDVVRYADTAGCNSDFPVPDAWRYRNYVIQAFNSDKPYNEFLREQIAGDLMTPKNDEDRQAKIVATGYLAISRRFASNRNEHHLTIDDSIDNLSKATMGLTVSCARCHDHKFDAIPQKDYYGIYGILESTTYPFPGVETEPRPFDFVALGGPGAEKRLQEWQTKVKDVYAKIRELRFGQGRLKPDSKEQIEKLKSETLSLELNPPSGAKAYAVQEGKPVNAFVQFKGDPKKLGDEVPRHWLTLFGGDALPPEEKGSGRRELAAWITDPKNPLMPRVMANRIWLGHFGKGIVPTPNDFGLRGEAPANPELLDWLASEFVRSNYSVKHMHKVIMTSRAYKLATTHSEASFQIDPKNAYQWHFDRRRLEAEEIRDSMMLISGKLDATPGGAHPFPAVHTWTYSQHRQFFADYPTDKRSVYVMQQRLRKNPLLETFDPADPNSSTGQRAGNITALQALAMMNSDFTHRMADEFAVRVGMARNDAAARVNFAHQAALGRPATPEEVVEGTRYLAKAEAALKASSVPGERQPRAALASYLRTLLSSDEFFFVD